MSAVIVSATENQDTDPDWEGEVNAQAGKIWRRGWDLNPRYPLRYVRFRGGSFQPLTHLSASDNSDTSNIGPSLYNAQDFGSGLPLRSRPLNASTFEADPFNHSRTSPRERQLWLVVVSLWQT